LVDIGLVFGNCLSVWAATFKAALAALGLWEQGIELFD
jgi:hypothetical protein